MGAGSMDHPQGLADPFAFHRFYNHTVNCACEFDNIVRGFCGLISKDGNIDFCARNFSFNQKYPSTSATASGCSISSKLYSCKRGIICSAWPRLQPAFASTN